MSTDLENLSARGSSYRKAARALCRGRTSAIYAACNSSERDDLLREERLTRPALSRHKNPPIGRFLVDKSRDRMIPRCAPRDESHIRNCERRRRGQQYHVGEAGTNEFARIDGLRRCSGGTQLSSYADV